ALVQLLLGFQQPQSGKIRLDGRDSTELSGSCIRRQISCVLQKTAIYAGTIRENVAMGKAGATDEEVWRALEIAQMKDYVESLPDGLDHRLELSGSNLSGGQRQRLAIARALIKDAPIYIFDDSFSALDFLTEARLRSRLGEELKGKTQIVVTQRVTTAKNSDCIFVMDQGRVLDWGRHEELLPRCRVYRDRKSTRLNSSHVSISYAVFCLKKKKKHRHQYQSCPPAGGAGELSRPAGEAGKVPAADGHPRLHITVYPSSSSCPARPSVMLAR